MLSVDFALDETLSVLGLGELGRVSRKKFLRFDDFVSYWSIAIDIIVDHDMDNYFCLIQYVRKSSSFDIFFRISTTVILS